MVLVTVIWVMLRKVLVMVSVGKVVVIVTEAMPE